MQVPDINYMDLYAPVVRDATIRIVFTTTLHNEDWECDTTDVEAAFLYPRMKIEVYIE